MRSLRAVNAKLQREADALKERVRTLEARRHHEAQAEVQAERATVVSMKQFVQQKVAAAEKRGERQRRTIEALQAQLTCVFRVCWLLLLLLLWQWAPFN